MPKCKTAFFSVPHNKTFQIGDEITTGEFDALPNGYKENFEGDDTVTVEITEQILSDNPELADAGVKVGENVTFTEAADAPEAE